ncbi:MAG: hypothetical protein ACLVJH_18660 [Faecalibacterium prausnitzii]
MSQPHPGGRSGSLYGWYDGLTADRQESFAEAWTDDRAGPR